MTISGHEMAVERRALQLGVGDGIEIAATAYLGSDDPKALVWCLPGGGVDRRYWDVPVDGAAEDEYSFPHRAVRAGYVVVAADHLSTGESTYVEVASADLVVDVMSQAVEVGRIALGVQGLPVIGIGHSMGSGLMLHQQDRHGDYDGMIVSGWSNLALTIPYTDGSFRELGAPGTPDFRRHNHDAEVTRAVIEASKRIRTTSPAPAVSWVTEAGRLAAAAGRVTVPVLLAHGRIDVSPDHERDAALYGTARSVDTLELPTSHHWHSGSADRHELWVGFVDWLDRVVADIRS